MVGCDRNSVRLMKTIMLLAILVISTAASHPASAFVVAELFESQGCSSCPPAESVLLSLEREFGRSLIILNHHVDYWDHLGWNDAFSSPWATERQKAYGRTLNQQSIYTPELIINGDVGFVGSDIRQARRRIRERLASPLPAIRIRLIPEIDRSVRLTANFPVEFSNAVQDAVVMIYEDLGPVLVERGENAGVVMSGRFTVRKIKPLQISKAEAHATLLPESTWNTNELHVVVLIQESGQRIRAAGIAPWPGKKP